jgi:glucose-6-phosphate 1-epimerase
VPERLGVASHELIDFHGLPAVRWRSADGASAVATLQGAHLVSWTLPDGEEGLFLSERSAFVAGKAIRGGIPVIFPQFADRGPLPQHGFARTTPWRFRGVQHARDATAAFALAQSPETEALWRGAFRMELRASIGGRRLVVTLHVMNDGERDFAFTAALHTYLRVTDATTARLRGLKGLRYLTRGESSVQVEERDAVSADEPVDRTYFATPSALRLEDGARTIAIAQRGFGDTVVWNPGRERTREMTDMPPESYRHMLCVEAAAIEPAVRLAPGAEWQGEQSIEINA